MRPLTPAIPDSERLAFCLFLALAAHGMAILGVTLTSPPPGTAPDFEALWAGDAAWPGLAETGQAPPWPFSLRSAPGAAHGSERAPEAYTLEREYARQWVARAERLGESVARDLEGEVVVHVTMDARGGVRRIEIEPGPEPLAAAARDVVTRMRPHAPFPEELRAHRDRLRISRRWVFGAPTKKPARERLRP